MGEPLSSRYTQTTNLIPKFQPRFPGFEQKITSMSACGKPGLVAPMEDVRPSTASQTIERPLKAFPIASRAIRMALHADVLNATIPSVPHYQLNVETPTQIVSALSSRINWKHNWFETTLTNHESLTSGQSPVHLNNLIPSFPRRHGVF